MNLEPLKHEISVSLTDPKRGGPKHWLGAEVPYAVYEEMIKYAKEKKMTLGQVMLHAFGCYFGLQCAIHAVEKVAKAIKAEEAAALGGKGKKSKKVIAVVDPAILKRESTIAAAMTKKTKGKKAPGETPISTPPTTEELTELDSGLPKPRDNGNVEGDDGES